MSKFVLKVYYAHKEPFCHQTIKLQWTEIILCIFNFTFLDRSPLPLSKGIRSVFVTVCSIWWVFTLDFNFDNLLYKYECQMVKRYAGPNELSAKGLTKTAQRDESLKTLIQVRETGSPSLPCTVYCWQLILRTGNIFRNLSFLSDEK